MGRVWITTGSTTFDAIVNPVTAACQRGYVPNTVFLLENPGVSDVVDRAVGTIAETIGAYGTDDPEVDITTLDTETAFEEVLAHLTDGIRTAQDADDAVAVDITPGRKFMSAIAFAAGMRYDADHVFYLYAGQSSYYGQSYAEIPRTDTTLYDFTEEL